MFVKLNILFWQNFTLQKNKFDISNPLTDLCNTIYT